MPCRRSASRRELAPTGCWPCERRLRAPACHLADASSAPPPAFALRRRARMRFSIPALIPPELPSSVLAGLRMRDLDGPEGAGLGTIHAGRHTKAVTAPPSGREAPRRPSARARRRRPAAPGGDREPVRARARHRGGRARQRRRGGAAACPRAPAGRLCPRPAAAARRRRGGPAPVGAGRLDASDRGVAADPAGDQPLEAVILGVRGLVPRAAAPEQLVRCVRVVHGGGQWLDPELVGRALDRFLAREAARQRAAEPALSPGAPPLRRFPGRRSRGPRTAPRPPTRRRPPGPGRRRPAPCTGAW